MAKPSPTPIKKYLIIIIFLIIILAALVKVGFVLYQLYWADNDTISRLIPHSARTYWHLSTNSEKEPVSLLQQLIEQKQLGQELKTIFNQTIETILAKRDINLENDILPEISGEIAGASLRIEEEDYQLLVIKTDDPFNFEQKIITKLRGDQPLSQIEYSEIKIKDFILEPALVAETKSDFLQIDEINHLYYSAIASNLIIATDPLPIELVIDTYKEKNDSLQSLLPADFASKPIYVYRNLQTGASISNSLSSLLEVWADQKIGEIFLAIEPGTEVITLEIKNDQSLLSNLQLSQKVSLDFLEYLPDDFDLAVLVKNFVQSIEEGQSSLKTNTKNLDLNSLAVITSLLPDKKLLDQLSDKDAMLLIKDDQYALVILDQEDQISQDFDQIRTGLLKISSLTNPSQQKVSFSEEDQAIELIPDSEQVIVTSEISIGQNFYSVPFQNDEIIFGRQANFIWLSNSTNLVTDSLNGSEHGQQFRDNLSNCSQAWRSELAIWPQVNLSADYFGQDLITDNQLIIGSDLVNNNLSINGCLF